MDTTASCEHCNVGDCFVRVEEEVAMRVNVGRRQDVRQAFDADKAADKTRRTMWVLGSDVLDSGHNIDCQSTRPRPKP